MRNAAWHKRHMRKLKKRKAQRNKALQKRKTPTMKPLQALQLIYTAARGAPLNADSHERVVQAAQQLEQFIKKHDAPEEKPEEKVDESKETPPKKVSRKKK